jgi:hypothetical protein
MVRRYGRVDDSMQGKVPEVVEQKNGRKSGSRVLNRA